MTPSPSRIAAVPWAALLVASTLAQERREVPRPASDPRELAAVRALLASDDPATTARGALRVRDGMLHELVPELRGILCNLPRFGRSDRRAGRMGGETDTLLAATVLEALDRTDARMPVEELLPWLHSYLPRDLALCMLLEHPDATAALLAEMHALARDDRDRLDGTIIHLAIGNHLTDARAPHPRWVDWLIEQAAPDLRVQVTDGLMAKGGRASTGLCGGWSIPDFPPVGVWTLTTHRPDGSQLHRLIAPGITSIWAVRHPVDADHDVPGMNALVDLRETPGAWLTSLARRHDDAPAPSRAPFPVSHRWKDADDFAREVTELRAATVEAWQPILIGLRRRGLLAADPLPAFEDPLVTVSDRRRDRTEPLLLPPGTRLAPARHR